LQVSEQEQQSREPAEPQTTSAPAPRPSKKSVPVVGRPLEVQVDERGLERAIRRLKRIVANEGVIRALKRGKAYEKPSVRKRRKRREAERRRRRAARRLARKR
jgi:small subunit ribosomal protein S21